MGEYFQMGTNVEYAVVEMYKSPYADPICFSKGERVGVGKESTHDPEWKDWFWCVGANENEAWVPAQYLSIEGRKGILLRDYNALELSVAPGELLLVSEILNGFGMAQKADGSRGWVPMKCLEKVGGKGV